MEPITTLLSQMSLESIILVIVIILAAAKALSELFDWGYGKIKSYFDVKDKAEERQDEIIKRLDRIENRSVNRDAEIEKINKNISLIQQRLQDSTKSYIIDKYHYYVQELGMIDEAALQDLERRYLYYRESGGNSYIENRMQELRDLPLITPEQLTMAQKESFEKMRHFLGGDDDGR